MHLLELGTGSQWYRTRGSGPPLQRASIGERVPGPAGPIARRFFPLSISESDCTWRDQFNSALTISPGRTPLPLYY